jgi:uncharacterized protein (DUF4415 family)
MKKEYGHPAAPGKTRITIRLDDAVLDWFRAKVNAAGGGDYQAMMNDVLRNFIRSQRVPHVRRQRRS